MTMSSSNNILQSLSVTSTVEKKNRSRRTHDEAKMDSNVANNLLLPKDDKENNIDSIFRLHSTATKQSKVRRDNVKGVLRNSNKKHDVKNNTRTTTKDETKDVRAASVDSPISIVDNNDTASNEMKVRHHATPSFMTKFLTIISIIIFIDLADTVAMITIGTLLVGLLTVPAIKHCYVAGASFMGTADYVHCFLECIIPFVSMIMTGTNSSEVILRNIVTQYSTTLDFLRFRIQMVIHPVTQMDPSKNEDDRRADKDHAAWLHTVCSQVEALFNSNEEIRITNFPVWFTERLECAFRQTFDRSSGTASTTTAAAENPAEDNMVNLINPWGVNISSYQVYERQCILRSLCVDETRLSVITSPHNKEI